MKTAIVWLTAGALAAMVVACGGSRDGGEQPVQPQGQPVDLSAAGEITGKVSFTGPRPRPALIHMDQDPVCMQKQTGAVYAQDTAVNNNRTLPNVFVYIKDGAQKYAYPTPSEPVTLDQEGCTYRPHVFGIMVGQHLRITSSDATEHNVHDLPRDPLNREWNESQQPGAAPLDKTFDRAEVMIAIKCNQHPWMKAYVGVLTNPLYAVTGSDGIFTIKGVPPGDYTLEAWSAINGPGGERREEKVAVKPKAATTVDFSFK